jgi:HD-GYP domain-containing protein (c-di-GMP phosphodiesterase class II)
VRLGDRDQTVPKERVELRTPTDVAQALSSHPPLRVYSVARHGEGMLELRFGNNQVLLAWSSLWRDSIALEAHLASASPDLGVVLCATEPEIEGMSPHLRERPRLAVLQVPLSTTRLVMELRTLFEQAELRRRVSETDRTVERYKYEIRELLETARALASERDVRQLLADVLLGARKITGADAGSLYVVARGEEESTSGRSLADHRGRPAKRILEFMLFQNDSLAVDFSPRSLPVDGTSIAGAATLSREAINLPDLYALEFGTNPWGFRHDRSFDERTGYQTRSMLTLPMCDARGEVIGVIQLINKKRDAHKRLSAPEDFVKNVVPFDAKSEELARALAAQAGVSLENALLYQEVRSLFDGFVNASILAIESRDPSTRGHSQRVATLTVGLARTVDAISSGPLAEVRFDSDQLKQIEYAGLLHDFGKVGVRENVLIKAKKLYEHERLLVLARFDYIRKALEADAARRKLEAPQKQWPEIEVAYRAQAEELERFIDLVLKANEPTVLPAGGFSALTDIAAHRYVTPRGEERPYLEPYEVQALSIPRGSLTQTERVEIESHVTHTYNFLRKIPWGRQFRDVPLIAGTHHEKLDGTGYPNGLRGELIPLEARMMAIADIFDALTASDRPYKKAVPLDKAFAILESEVKTGKCDPELYRVFVEAEIYKLVLK